MERGLGGEVSLLPRQFVMRQRRLRLRNRQHVPLVLFAQLGDFAWLYPQQHQSGEDDAFHLVRVERHRLRLFGSQGIEPT